MHANWTSMLRVMRGAEFETVVIDAEDKAYLVRARVTARQLQEADAEVALRAAKEGISPLLAVRSQGTSLESGDSYVEPGEFLQDLGALALANGSQK